MTIRALVPGRLPALVPMAVLRPWRAVACSLTLMLAELMAMPCAACRPMLVCNPVPSAPVRILCT